MTQLPPSLQAFATLLDAQPGPVQIIFQYLIAQMMVEAGLAQLIGTEPGEAGARCTFRTVAGDEFTVIKPLLSEAQEAEMMEGLREILGEEGGL